MQRQQIVEKFKADSPDLKQLDVATLKLFGSVARNEAHATSDIDMLVRFQHGSSYDRFMDLTFHLEALLGFEVDLVTEDALRSEMRQSVEKDALLVA